MLQNFLRFSSKLLISFAFLLLISSFINDFDRLFSSQLVDGYRVKSTTDPSFECSGCARTRLIGCFHGQCSYRCYRSCTNGTSAVIEAHRFVLEGHRRRRKRYF